ncbi:MAG: 50S ribosomal protein L10 [Bacteroidetes bacterium GWE2_39_28]|jgi:large subunit ribosomal protein L10|nr:MAG: 50S ribosomal protein L10 [Bacteroidetes bacterium GWE2_39_28]OFY13274.1 MAG: 50S ribosomal protein L10 [Bacteroidetes bacterium GWF2_39_10]OFZ08026.1 MAG: 50S ribosomal protein L10 [Bacteroidetes bacterium RIFOXYB2_FULL_39_7]OFZ11439.1 MAG: 50S ribosomal protein L10 [Bacteroidetes bacterium RIFOXYC2_FULL_39_11]HCT93201.1 50S ribosomal protein L10 [Rikenellaceae bacterium]
MKKDEKTQIIASLAAQLEKTPNFYIADISGLNAEKTAKLRRACFEKEIKLMVVKNTLLRKALEKTALTDSEALFPILEGPTAVMFTETVNIPAKLIKEFGKEHGKPVLKGALVQECAYVGENQLEALISIKSREELIGDIIGLLQSPVQNVISALVSSGGGKIAGIVKTLSEKE